MLGFITKKGQDGRNCGLKILHRIQCCFIQRVSLLGDYLDLCASDACVTGMITGTRLEEPELGCLQNTSRFTEVYHV